MEVKEIDIVFSAEGYTIHLNGEDYTDRVRKIVFDFEAEKKEDRINMELHPVWWPEFKKTFK